MTECPKRKYTHGGAKIALSIAKFHRKRFGKWSDRKEQRYYECPMCPEGTYHLTSKVENEAHQ